MNGRSTLSEVARTVHSRHHHYGWDNSIEPCMHIDPGSTIKVECLDASGGQIDAHSGVADVGKVAFDKVNPVTGPIFVDGAEPGDALKVTFEEFIPSGLGWTANIPGFGLLADTFVEPALHVWHYDARSMTPALFSHNARVPLQPFTGTIGVAPAECGFHSIIPPRRVGGNMDTRDLTVGTCLYLPVEVAGALLSVGDTHAAQGDGEICGTALESAMDVVLTVDVVKDEALRFPRFTTKAATDTQLASKGFHVTTGVGPSLMDGAREAVLAMVEMVAKEHHMNEVDAYLLASTCASLRISEVVDAPNWVVSFYFPRSVFE